jgi:hypothetical protein
MNNFMLRKREVSMIIKLAKSSLRVFSLALLATLLQGNAGQIIASSQSTSISQNSKDGTSTWTWSHSDKGLRTKVRINGKVEFNDDYTQITSISNGGSISLEEERNGTTRKYEALSSFDGSIKQSYFVQGEARPMDSDGRAWLNRMLLETVRQSAYDAKPRVGRILKQKGANGVLEEISQIKSDYAKRIYFEELMTQAKLDGGTGRRLIQQATREVSSDYEKAQVLTKAGELFLSDEAIRATYLEGVNSISSDYEKSRVLQGLLKRNDLSRETLGQVIKATSLISSDYEKTRVLMAVVALGAKDEATYNALIEASKTVGSDYEKARLLMKATEVSTGNEAAHTAYLESVRTISSDYEKGRVLQALLKRENPGKETLKRIIKLSSSISSDYEAANVLVKIAPLATGDEALRSALVEAAKGISSEHERGRVLNAIFK